MLQLHASKNLTPYDQHLAWKLKKAGVIYSSRSSKGIIKLRHTGNEHPISIYHEDRIAALYLDFIFKQRHNFKDRK